MPRTRVRDETSAGGVVYRVDNGQPRFLLIRDSYRNWGFPKGHLESGEAPDAAALRVGDDRGKVAVRVHGTGGGRLTGHDSGRR